MIGPGVVILQRDYLICFLVLLSSCFLVLSVKNTNHVQHGLASCCHTRLVAIPLSEAAKS
jgi:hypothetical protein